MSAPAAGLSFFCDDFRPSSRDPLACEKCDHLEAEHPVHVGDVAPLDVEAPSPAAAADPWAIDSSALEDDEWRAWALARCDQMHEELRAGMRRLDEIGARLEAFKRSHAIP